MSAMSESAEVESTQSASNSDLVENELQIEANGDPKSDRNGIPLIRSDVDNGSDSKTIECVARSESEQDFGTTVMTRVTQLNGINGLDGMRGSDTDRTDPTPAPDVGSDTDSRHSGDGVDQMPDHSSQDSQTTHSTCASNCDSTDNEIVIVETVVKSDSNEVTLITDTTIKTIIKSNDSQSQSQKSSDSTHDTSNTGTKIEVSNEPNKVNTKIAVEMTTTTNSRPKQLKGLLKKAVRDRSMKASGDRKRVRFSETMQVFCDDWPQNLMPQIIALKSPTDFNLVEVQGYMFEPPVEYQDFLPFDPPPDYRDLIANSLCAFDNDLSINYIDDVDDDDESNGRDHRISNEYSSKWESMILNNNESLEEEQIIGVLKEDAILAAIGSHMSLPTVDENLCPEDFPIHFQNKSMESSAKLAESELSDITSDDGNDSQSSPTGSLQDIQSDSSITSQDTIILINNDNNESIELLTNKNIFKDLKKSNEEINNSSNSESVVKCMTDSEQKPIKSDPKDDSSHRELMSETNESLICNESNEKSRENNSVNGEEEVDSAADVAHHCRSESDESASSQIYCESDSMPTNDTNDRQSSQSDAQLNSDRRKLNLFVNTTNGPQMQTNHTNSFKKNLMFYENMYSNANNSSAKSENISKGEKPIKQTVSHFFIENSPQLPIITQTVGNNISDNNKHINQSSLEVKQISSQFSDKTENGDSGQPVPPTRAPPQHSSQTQPNANNWSADEFIIEYTSEPKALVPSKRTASLSNFSTAQMNTNPHFIRTANINTINDIQYLSLTRNGEIPKQWTTYSMNSHNSSQMNYQNPPIQRSLSPNPPMVSTANRPVSPQQAVFYQRPPQYCPRYPTAHAMPVQVMYNRMPGQPPVQQRMSLGLPVMSQTLGRPHKTPPPYHYHIQQHSNEFPNPSEIRRRDGLNAYPHVLNQMPTAGTLPVPPIHHQNSQNPSTQNMSKDELEQFVEQDIQRTERIKKRYSMTEEDDPSFGFARRPSVRGIRPKFESTNEILKQMQTPNNSAIGSQMAGSHQSWPQNVNSMNNYVHHNSLPKKPHIVQIRFQPQNPSPTPMSVNQSVGDTTQSTQSLHSNPNPNAKAIPGQQMSRTFPRPSSLISQSQMNAIRSEDGFVIRLPANVNREQLKQQIQRQIELQFQSKMKQKTTAMAANPKPMMSSNDERGAPEGASSSPKHSSDLLFAKNLSTNSNPGIKGGETTANKATNDTKKLLVINSNNPDNTGTTTNSADSQGVIYYAMNV